MSHHLRFNLNLVELLPGVDTDDRPNHLRHHNHISQVCLDQVGLLICFRFLLGLAQLLDKSHRLTFETSVESTTSSGVDYIT
jgi:hypothetical protein